MITVDQHKIDAIKAEQARRKARKEAREKRIADHQAWVARRTKRSHLAAQLIELSKRGSIEWKP